MTACPDKLLLLQAHADGELDAANAIALEAHIRGCSACAEEMARIEALGAMLGKADLAYQAPADLRLRLEALLAPAEAQAARARTAPAPQRRRGGWPAALRLGSSWGTGLVTGLALSAALVFALPQITRPHIEDELIANHIRSLSLGSHLTDIATSDRHVVKPWFNGKVDFAPHVPELAAQGFPLVGGRLDVLGGHEVAAIVYKRRLHTINLFVRPAPAWALPAGTVARQGGYSLLRWTDGGLEYWAISDIDIAELKLFHQSFIGQPSL
jgi:anti-sigma factor RsiW